MALAGTLFTTGAVAAGSGYGAYGYPGVYGGYGAGYGYGGVGYGYGGYGGYGCGRRVYGTSTAVILVLFILLVIVSRSGRNNIGC